MNQWRGRLLASGLALAIGGSGCGAIVQGSQVEVPIKTRPAKAEVWVDGIKQGEAPLKVAMQVDTPHVVLIRAPGYQEQTIRTDRALGAGFVVADILLGVIPVIIDGITGCWYKVEPPVMNVMLTPEGGAPTATAETATAETAP